MTSFAFRLEPAPAPRLVAAVLLFHAFAAAAPWLARVPAAAAIVLNALAIGGFALSLARFPGRHCRLAGIRHGRHGWRIRLAGRPGWLPAELCAASRAYPCLVYIRLRAGRRRLAWLLARGSVPQADFRRLKARIRLAC